LIFIELKGTPLRYCRMSRKKENFHKPIMFVTCVLGTFEQNQWYIDMCSLSLLCCWPFQGGAPLCSSDVCLCCFILFWWHFCLCPLLFSRRR
jgi:hypothetical protein